MVTNVSEYLFVFKYFRTNINKFKVYVKLNYINKKKIPQNCSFIHRVNKKILIYNFN